MKCFLLILVFVLVISTVKGQDSIFDTDTVEFVQVATHASTGHDGCYLIFRKLNDFTEERKCDTIRMKRLVYLKKNKVYWQENLSDSVIRFGLTNLHEASYLHFKIVRKKKFFIYNSLEKNRTVLFKASLIKGDSTAFPIPYYLKDRKYSTSVLPYQSYTLKYKGDTILTLNNRNIDCYHFEGRMYTKKSPGGTPELFSDIFFEVESLLPVLLVDKEYIKNDVTGKAEKFEYTPFASSIVLPVLE